LIEGTFDTLEIWKCQREKDENVIKTIKGKKIAINQAFSKLISPASM